MVIGIDASRGFEEQRTGTETYTFEILKHILMLPGSKDHEWILYTKKLQDTKTQNLQIGKNVKTIEIKLPRLWTQVGLAYRTWVDKLDTLWVPAHTLPVLANPKVKTVVTVHGLEYEWLPSYENWLQKWYLPFSTWFVAKRARHLIAVSYFTESELVNRLRVNPKNISVVYEGVTEERLNTKHQGPNKDETLNRFGLKSKQYILFVGTIQPRKNLKRLIEAFGNLRKKNLQLVIAGKWGWGYEDIPRDARNVVFTGYLTPAEKDELLRNAFVYVQPSITEGFGLPVIEAMQAGVPVVSSSGGALSEIVGEAGVIFNPVNVNDMCHKLSLVTNSHKLQKEFITKGLQRAKEFTWDRAARETLQVIESVYSK